MIGRSEDATTKWDACGRFVRMHETTIEWTAYNKPSKVTNTKNGKITRYLYDAMGNRVLKFTEEISDPAKRALTYHVRDAQGNILSTYEAGKKKTTYQDESGLIYHFDAKGILTKVTRNEQDVTNNVFTSLRIDDKHIGRIIFIEGQVILCVSDKNRPTPTHPSECIKFVELTETTTFDNTLRQTEVPIYGSDRIGMYTPRVDIDDQPEIGTNMYSRARGAKRYELKDHLGNIRVTVSDRKIAVTNGNQITYHAEVMSYTDYYPFGMAMPTRNYQSPEIGEHRYGFNGKENDTDFGDGIQDYGFRIYDELVCQWLSVDPLAGKNVGHSPYEGFARNPIIFVDPDGRDVIITIKGNTIIITSKIYIVHDRYNTDFIAKNIQNGIMKKWGKDFAYKDKDGKEYIVKFDIKVEAVKGKKIPTLKAGENLVRLHDDKNNSSYVEDNAKRGE